MEQFDCEVSGERVIYDGRGKKVQHLNSTLTWIRNRCDGNTSVQAMAAAFERDFSADNGTHIVMAGLDHLDEGRSLEEAIRINKSMAAETATVSRRSVMADGSVLMPLVVSMLAPTSAAAKSPEPTVQQIRSKTDQRPRRNKSCFKVDAVDLSVRNG